MTDMNFPLSADGDMDMDDLPRTLRREKEARARAAREQADSGLSATDGYPADDSYAYDTVAELAPAAVHRFDVPFLHLMMFFLKAVLAAVPALILLGIILWFMGQALEVLYPELVKMKILISFPN